jgi:hypothetical protein
VQLALGAVARPAITFQKVLMYTLKQTFLDEIKRHYSTIKGQNSWAKKYFELEMPANTPHEEVSAERCWNLYVASRDNALGILLLGEVSMRSKLALVQNFGLTSAYGHEDDEPWLSPWLGYDVKDPVAARADLSKVPASTLDATKNQHLKGLQGPGSILSDRLWTPLMNDAWLLGGVQKKQGFHLVTEGLGQQKLEAAMNRLTSKVVFEQRRAKFDATKKKNESDYTAATKAIWQQWFLDNPQYLYENWGPRVLVREMIGLMTFGYKPVFLRQELAFECDDDKRAMDSTICGYSDALNALLFHQGNDPLAKSTVLKALSTWLFGKDDVLK